MRLPPIFRRLASRWFWVACAAMLLTPGGRAAETAPGFDAKAALRTSQAAIGNLLGAYPLTDATGRRVAFGDFRGKPLVISLVYTSCYQICPMTTRHLVQAVAKAREALGEKSFHAILVGFDAKTDTPEAMRYFAAQQGVPEQGWSVLSIDAENVEALARDLGFTYFPSAAGFDHIIQTTIADAGGRIYRQVYGQVFDIPLLVEPLKELVLGRPKPSQGFFAGLVDKVRLFCTTYDPARDGYYFDYSLFIGLFIGATIILGGALFLFREILHRRRSPRA